MCRVEHAGRSDTGRKRSVNQDRWAVDPDQHLFVVADGVGGSSNGALAAGMVIELLPTYVRRHLQAGDRDDWNFAEGIECRWPLPYILRLGRTAWL